MNKTILWRSNALCLKKNKVCFLLITLCLKSGIFEARKWPLTHIPGYKQMNFRVMILYVPLISVSWLQNNLFEPWSPKGASVFALIWNYFPKQEKQLTMIRLNTTFGKTQSWNIAAVRLIKEVTLHVTSHWRNMNRVFFYKNEKESFPSVLFYFFVFFFLSLPVLHLRILSFLSFSKL